MAITFFSQGSLNVHHFSQWQVVIEEEEILLFMAVDRCMDCIVIQPLWE